MTLLGLLIFVFGVFKIIAAHQAQDSMNTIIWAAVAIMGVLVLAGGLTQSEMKGRK